MGFSPSESRAKDQLAEADVVVDHLEGVTVDQLRIWMEHALAEARADLKQQAMNRYLDAEAWRVVSAIQLDNMRSSSMFSIETDDGQRANHEEGYFQATTCWEATWAACTTQTEPRWGGGKTGTSISPRF